MTALDDATIVRLRADAVERTPQRLDPLGVQSAWLLVPLLGARRGGVRRVLDDHATAVRSSTSRSRWSAIVVLAAGRGLVLASARIPASHRSGGGRTVGRRRDRRRRGLSVLRVRVGTQRAHPGRLGQIAVALLLVDHGAVPPDRRGGRLPRSSPPWCSAIVAAAQAPSLIDRQRPARLRDRRGHADPRAGLRRGRLRVDDDRRDARLARGGAGRPEPAGTPNSAKGRRAWMIAQETHDDTQRRGGARSSTAVLARGRVTRGRRDSARAIAERLRDASVASRRPHLAGGDPRAGAGQRAAQSIRAGRAPDRSTTPTGARTRPERRPASHRRRAHRHHRRARPASTRPQCGSRRRDPGVPSFALICTVAEPRRELRRELLPFLSALRSRRHACRPCAARPGTSCTRAVLVPWRREPMSTAQPPRPPPRRSGSPSSTTTSSCSTASPAGSRSNAPEFDLVAAREHLARARAQRRLPDRSGDHGPAAAGVRLHRRARAHLPRRRRQGDRAERDRHAGRPGRRARRRRRRLPHQDAADDRGASAAALAAVGRGDGGAAAASEPVGVAAAAASSRRPREAAPQRRRAARAHALRRRAHDRPRWRAR